MIGSMFGYLPYPLTLAILLGSMVAAVVVTAALEVRTPRRRRYLDARTAARPVETVPVETVPVEMMPVETVPVEMMPVEYAGQ
ncbi:MAG: hypothetical protein M5U19_06440 [Microthrixaceae bacterium]|nr:hypothetical protein [Microthrixaceae bacterium]